MFPTGRTEIVLSFQAFEFTIAAQYIFFWKWYHSDRTSIIIKILLFFTHIILGISAIFNTMYSLFSLIHALYQKFRYVA